MSHLAIPSPGKRCRCGARRDQTARRCAKCRARQRYRRATHYRTVARHRAARFYLDHQQWKDMSS
jgi:hypothetical protein